MKKINLFVWIYLLISCSGVPEIAESDIEYIDYSCCSQEELSLHDQILLDNIKFEEGKLSCSLNLEDALEQGIPEKKYGYFLVYLTIKDQTFEKYLESGAIIFYNGEPFTRNEELYQYVGTKEEALSRADYNRTGILWRRDFSGGLIGEIVTDEVRFKATSQIMVASSNGFGTFELNEKEKGLMAYIDGKVSSAMFKWGFGNDVEWKWKIKYVGRAYTQTKLEFIEFWEEPIPEFPSINTGEEKRWWSNMPTSAELTHNKINDYINIYIKSVGVYFAQVYKKEDDKYILHDSIRRFDGYTNVFLRTPREQTFWIVIYIQEIGYENVSWTYWGDMEFRFPLHWLGGVFD